MKQLKFNLLVLLVLAAFTFASNDNSVDSIVYEKIDENGQILVAIELFSNGTFSYSESGFIGKNSYGKWLKSDSEKILLYSYFQGEDSIDVTVSEAIDTSLHGGKVCFNVYNKMGEKIDYAIYYKCVGQVVKNSPILQYYLGVPYEDCNCLVSESSNNCSFYFDFYGVYGKEYKLKNSKSNKFDVVANPPTSGKGNYRIFNNYNLTVSNGGLLDINGCFYKKENQN